MDYCPLAPNSNHFECHEVSCVTLESFQDILNRKTFRENIGLNASKFDVQDVVLAEAIQAVDDIYETEERDKLNFEALENQIIENQAQYMLSRDKDSVTKDALELKRVQILREVAPEEAEKMKLIRNTDLLQHTAEQLLDFEINTSKHGCPVPFICCKDDLDMIPSKLQRTLEVSKPIGSGKKEDRLEDIPAALLRTHPKEIKFVNYEVNITYEKILKLKNISKHTQSIFIHRLPKDPVFSVKPFSSVSRVAPGMSAVYVVSFITDVYKDTKDTVSFKCCGGQTIAVDLTSWREPPHLQVFVYEDASYLLDRLERDSFEKSFDDTRASALNYTFDCGSCLLGDRKSISLIVWNEGGKASFFLVTENDWYLQNVQSIDGVSEFDICPVYFATEKNEVTEIRIVFTPLYFGLHTQKLFLLCDNITYEEVDIIGDGMLFEKHYIDMQVEKKTDRLSYFDSESLYYIYMGECLPFAKKACAISVHNSSSLNFPYRWEIRNNVSYNPLSKLNRMDPSWFHISHTRGILRAESYESFEVVFHVGSCVSGLYSTVIGLYILDVPEVSLAPNTDYVVINKKSGENSPLGATLVDVLIGEIEIGCTVVSLNVSLDPPEMILPVELGYKEAVVRPVYVTTTAESILECNWKILNKRNGQKCCVKVEPTRFSIMPGVPAICQLTICAHTYNDVQEKLILLINDGASTKEYNVAAKIASPKICVSPTLLDFGCVTVDLPSTKVLSLKSLCCEEIHWKIFEFSYSFSKRRLVQIEKSNVSQTSGVLNGGDVTEIKYRVNAKEVHRWFSFLIMLISYPTHTLLRTPVLILYEAVEPKIIIHTPTSTLPVICMHDLLNVNVVTHAVLCMHNVSKVQAYFLWGKPVGEQKDSIDIQFNPRAAVINPREVFKITVTLKPLKTGTLENIFVPCFVGRVAEPVILTVMCAVDSIHVLFKLPMHDVNEGVVLWPPPIIDEYGENLFKPPEMLYEENIAEPFVNESQCTKNISRPKADFQKSLFSSNRGLLSVKSMEKYRDDWILFEQTPQSSSNHSIKSKSLLADHVADFILEQNYIEIHNVPVKTPVKKTLAVQNLTAMTSCFRAEVTNYKPLRVKSSLLENLMSKSDRVQYDPWGKLVPPENGIIVKLNPTYKKLYGHQQVDIELWIYASTWGVYVEEVVIELEDIAPFCFSVLIEVIGSPIEYTFALNSLYETPMLRLGNIPYGTALAKRNIRLKNVSSIPIFVRWHIYMQPRDDEKKLPINVVCDVRDVAKSNPEKRPENSEQVCLLISEFYGHEASCDIFQLHPRELFLLPNTSNTLCISFNPEIFSKKYKLAKIEAVAVGYIDVTEEYRPVNADLSPTKLRINGLITIPLLEIQHVKGDLCITAFACDLIQSEGLNCTKNLVFRNTSNAIGRINMHIKSPFTVVRMRSCEVDNEDPTIAAVAPGACLEVSITCTVSLADVNCFAGCLSKENNIEDVLVDTDNKSVTVIRNLNIHQKGVTLQVIPLQLTLYYPEIMVEPTTIHFGDVWIGNSSKASFTIYSTSEVPVPFNLQCSEGGQSAFKITPSCGFIPKAMGDKRGEVIINVWFLPNDVRLYDEVITVDTNIPGFSKKVNVVARGSINQIYYADD